jgi:glutamyl-tRNA reductase
VGISHWTVSADLLDHVRYRRPLTSAVRALLAQPHIGEAVVLSTCNRMDIYSGVSGCHPRWPRSPA